MFANAAEMVTRTGSLPVTRLFALALMKMTSGELDQDAAAFDVGKDVQQYLWRIGGKTAALMANATEGGAVLGGCDERTVEAMRTFGYSLGMAFQIVDDILDFTGDEELMGKPVGSDLLEGTVTLPGLLFLERYPRDNPIKKFFTARRDRHARLQEALDAINASDVIQASMDIAADYVRRANAAIGFLPASDARECLLELGDYVLNRRS
jgi:geranylgeranyl pyrophosphate synthase